MRPKIIDGIEDVKARLVMRGYEEDDEFQRDSPMCKRESVRLSLAILSTMAWKLQSIDVKTAFLQGKAIERNVYLKPPREAEIVETKEDSVWSV